MFAQMSFLQRNMIGTFQSFWRSWVTFPSISLVTLLEMLLAGLCVVEACFSMNADVFAMKKREMHACWARLCKACGSQSLLCGQHPPESELNDTQERPTTHSRRHDKDVFEDSVSTRNLSIGESVSLAVESVTTASSAPPLVLEHVAKTNKKAAHHRAPSQLQESPPLFLTLWPLWLKPTLKLLLSPQQTLLLS